MSLTDKPIAMQGDLTRDLETLFTYVQEVDERLDRQVNVKDYGAVGDGVADDTEAIQDAIDYAVSSNKRNVVMGEGTFLFTSLSITANNFSITGHSKVGTKLKISGTGNGLVFENNERIVIKDMTIMGDGTTAYGADATSGYGMYFNDVANVNIENVWFKYLGNHAVYLEDGCWSFNITNCDMDHVKGDGINAIALSSSAQKNAINIIGCKISATEESGINVWGANINIQNCVIQSSKGAGVEISSDNVTGDYAANNINIMNNYFEETAGACVYIKGELVGSDARYVDNVNIRNNYMALTDLQANVGVTALIQCSSNGQISSPTIRLLHIENNTYITDLAYVDGNDKLGTTSSVVLKESGWTTKFINPGYAKIINNPRSITLPGYIYCRGAEYTDYMRYSNSITEDTNVYFPLPLPTNAQFINMGMYVTTDATDYNFILSVYRRAKESNDAYEEAIYTQRSNLNGSQYVTSLSVSAVAQSYVDAMRLSSDYEYIVRLRVAFNTAGTVFRFGSLTLNYVE